MPQINMCLAMESILNHWKQNYSMLNAEKCPYHIPDLSFQSDPYY